MNKTKIRIMITAAIFLFVSLGYCQELSDWERKIYYDTAWLVLQNEYQLSIEEPSDAKVAELEAKAQQFLNQNGITQEQLEDIIRRGNKMPFSSTEEELVQEMNREITDNLTPDEIMVALNNFAYEYGMSIGQVSSVFTRRNLND